MARRLQESDAELSEQIKELGQAREAAYERERALSERMRGMEEKIAILQARTEPPPIAAGVRRNRASAPASSSPSRSKHFSAADTYQAALVAHHAREFDVAISRHREILQRAPASSLADNAQYWIGEAKYALGSYSEALAEFVKVMGYETTEKADDAQMMIGRCYLALDEREQAARAFRKLLADYEESEYAGEARQALRRLGETKPDSE